MIKFILHIDCKQESESENIVKWVYFEILICSKASSIPLACCLIWEPYREFVIISRTYSHTLKNEANLIQAKVFIFFGLQIFVTKICVGRSKKKKIGTLPNTF